MDAQKTRIILIVALSFIIFTLFSNWQQQQPKSASNETSLSTETSAHFESEVPQINANRFNTSQQSNLNSTSMINSAIKNPIEIETDVLRLKINPEGGDIIYAELKEYLKDESDSNKGVDLLAHSPTRNYIAQSYLIADQSSSTGPDNYNGQRALYQSDSLSYSLNDKEELEVNLEWTSENNIKFIKRFKFKKSQYLVDVEYWIENHSGQVWQGNAFYQLRREVDKKSLKKGFLTMQTFQGGAYYTPDKPFNKMSFDKMKSNPLNDQIRGGWVAMLEHYFIATWVPSSDSLHQYYSKFSEPNIYKIGAVSAVQVPTEGQGVSKSQIYIGPEKADLLKEISPGLNLTVDYGILWPISQCLFWLLKAIQDVVKNWGLAIILVTVCIKLVFYKLSAASYRSMGHMRRIQPKLQALKERFGDDRQGFSQAMMELYKKEKINPLGGCLPILLQIPVFIALYYVLLESVELRQAPFMFWITDLSSKDPYYALPLLMGATMFLQQKLSPAPPDPMQAKMMMFMPVIFTFLFMSFPAGLVLYWTVNNLLSILQQWYITRGLEKEGLKRA